MIDYASETYYTEKINTAEARIAAVLAEQAPHYGHAEVEGHEIVASDLIADALHYIDTHDGTSAALAALDRARENWEAETSNRDEEQAAEAGERS